MNTGARSMCLFVQNQNFQRHTEFMLNSLYTAGAAAAEHLVRTHLRPCAGSSSALSLHAMLLRVLPSRSNEVHRTWSDRDSQDLCQY